MRFKRFLFFLVIFMGFSGQAMAEKWIEYKTDNFLVYSNAKRKNVESLVTELEYYRYYLQILTNVNATKSKIPLKIYAMRNMPREHLSIEPDVLSAYGETAPGSSNCGEANETTKADDRPPQ